MKSFANILLLLIVSFIVIKLSWADETKKAIARVFGNMLYMEDPNPSEKEMESYRRDRPQSNENDILLYAREKKLGSLIWGPISSDFESKYAIEPNDDELTAFEKAMKRLSSKHDGDGKTTLSEEELKNSSRYVSRMFVRQWKESKALYEQYGGKVIFQQGNPLEPVGAYRKLLEEHQRKGNFEIFDEALNKKFWEYYVSDHYAWTIPESKVDYSRPWWLQDQDEVKAAPYENKSESASDRLNKTLQVLDQLFQGKLGKGD